MAAEQISINLPSKSDPRWRALVLGTTTTTPKLLALKLMLSRISMAAKRDGSPVTVQKGIDELYDFFERNPRIVGADIANFFATTNRS